MAWGEPRHVVVVVWSLLLSRGKTQSPFSLLSRKMALLIHQPGREAGLSSQLCVPLRRRQPGLTLTRGTLEMDLLNGGDLPFFAEAVLLKLE